MIEINFFEKKEHNRLPYLIGSLFLLLFFLIGLYFLAARNYYETAIAKKNNWIADQAEEIELSTQLYQYKEKTENAIAYQTTLKAEQEPIDQLIKKITGAVPDEINQIASFEFSDSTQIRLRLINTDTRTAQQIVENIRKISYIDRTQLIHAENTNIESNELDFELLINLHDNWIIGEE